MTAANTDTRLETAKQFLEYLITRTDGDCSSSLFDTTVLSGLKIEKVEHGRCLCRLQVVPKLQNRYATLHGGCIATIVDTVSTVALVTVCEHTGVSTNLSVNYLSPMPGGEEALIDARVLKVGQKLATLQVDLRRAKTGQLVATGMHTKYLEVRDAAMAAVQKGTGAATMSKL